MATLGSRIRELRKSANMTGAEFGKKFGVSKSTVSLYENNHSTPDDSIKKAICDYFKVSLDYLMGYTDIKEPAGTLTKPADDAPRGYYHDPETARIAEEMRTDPQIRAMADATRGMTPEQMKEIMEYIRFQKAKERGDYDF